MTTLSLEISNPCNERCLHCYRTGDEMRRGFLSLCQAQSAIAQAAGLGATNATITGGEALLNPDWRGIVSAASDAGLRVSLFTNGTLLTAEDADFLGAVKNLKEVQISLYSLDDDTHDAITGVRGSCKKTKNAIRLLRAVCHKQLFANDGGGKGVRIFISSPAMKENVKTTTDLMKWCDKNNIDSCVDPFIFDSPDGENLKHRLTERDLRAFFEETMQDGGATAYIWGKGFGKRDLTKVDFYGGATNGLCVSGDGNIYPMIGWYEKLGNIESDSLADVYNNSPLLQKIRRIKAADFAECRACDAADFCTFCPNAHLAANGGEVGKLDKDACAFVSLCKEFAAERDRRLQHR